MSVMGVKIDQLDVPVCTSFRPKIIQDQFCYTVDPNEYKHKINVENDLSFSLFINYNEDKEMSLKINDTSVEDPFIIVETIGKTLKCNNK